MYEKIFRKEYKEVMKIGAILCLLNLYFYWKITLWGELRMKKLKIKNFIFQGLGAGQGTFFKSFFLGVWGSVCITVKGYHAPLQSGDCGSPMMQTKISNKPIKVYRKCIRTYRTFPMEIVVFPFSFSYHSSVLWTTI